MKSVKCLLFAFGLFCFAGVHGQGADLRLDSNSLSGFPDTIALNQAYITAVTIYNDSATDFTGVITFGALINGDSITADSGFSSTLYYPSASIMDTVPAGGHVTRDLVINVTNPPFIIGSSGVVIWPIAYPTNGSQIVKIPDSISKTFTVLLYPVGIDEIAERNLKVYMNGEQLMINDNGEYLLKNVRLYDVTGNLLHQEAVTISGGVDMSQYAPGVYFAEINFADNTRAVVKVVNTR